MMLNPILICSALHTDQLLIALHVAPRGNHSYTPTAHSHYPQRLCIFSEQHQYFAQRLVLAPDTWPRCSRHMRLLPEQCRGQVRSITRTSSSQNTNKAVTYLGCLLEHEVSLFLKFRHTITIKVQHAEQILGSKASMRCGNFVPIENVRYVNFE
jgi:hypothetical protein